MGISSLMVEWMVQLKEHGILKDNSSLLDLGPQDLHCRRECLLRSVGRLGPNALKLAEEIFLGKENEWPVIGRQELFYRALGVTTYESADKFDDAATYPVNLNYLSYLPKRFDLVTNYGTSEHVFNIGTSFATTFNFLRPGGLALFVLPTFGHINHGFYNIHPAVYYDLANANGYKIEDFQYIDNFGVRCLRFQESAVGPFNFSQLPIQLGPERRISVSEESRSFASFVTLNYVLNFTAADNQELLKKDGGNLYDYCFVAIRKSSSSTSDQFKIPAQGTYITNKNFNHESL